MQNPETLNVGDLQPSALQYRKSDNLDELAATIKEKGILQRLVVRAVGDHYEIVCGERRWRAAQLAGLTEVPVDVRELDDVQARECMLIENGSRSDATALEEADSYKILHESHGMSVEDIAAKVGKSRSSVYGRLRLADICKEARKALEDNKITAGAAMVLSRLQPKQQAEAVKNALGGWRMQGTGPVTASEMSEDLETYTQDLREASFDTTDDALVPGAGACTVCPKRSGNQRDLFGALDPDGTDPETCTDATCFKAKNEADWARKSAAAAARGVRVLDAKTAVVNESGLIARGYVNAADKPHEAYLLRHPKTWKELAGKHLQPMLTRDPSTGAAIEVYREEEARKAVPEATAKVLWKKGGQGASRMSASERATQLKQRVRRAATTAAIAEVVRQADTHDAGAGVLLWDLFARGMAELALHDTASEIAKRRGLDTKVAHGHDPRGAVRKLVDELSASQQRGLAIELLITANAYFSYGSTVGNNLKLALELYGLEYKSFEAKAKAELQAAKMGTKPKAKAPAAKGKKKPVTGVCSKCGCTEDHVCEGGCSWANKEKTLCTSCAS